MAEPVIVSVWAAVVKVVIPMLPGAMGAALALKFLGEELTAMQKITSFCVGFACAVYVAPIIIELVPVMSVHAQAGTEFLVGLFALATCRELFREINDADVIGTIKAKFFGPKS